MSVSTTLKKFGLEQAFKYLYKDPEKNLLKLMDWADKFAGEEFVTQRKLIREAITDPDHPYHAYVRHILEDVQQTGLTNMFDSPMVQRIAFDNGYYELVNFIEEHKKEYGHLILTGEFPEGLEL